MKNILNKKLVERYSRQIILKDVGPSGQKKIIKSRVLVVGAGGLGCPVIDYLSRAGVGNIGIIDHDKINISNIHRQSLYNTKDIGKFKVNVLKKKIKLVNSQVKIKTFKKRIEKKNIEKIFKVKVLKVNTIKKKSTVKIIRGRNGTKKGFKKAIITLKKGQSIDLGTGA